MTSQSWCLGPVDEYLSKIVEKKNEEWKTDDKN